MKPPLFSIGLLAQFGRADFLNGVNMKCKYCGNEISGSYGKGYFCNIVCKNRFNFIKARKGHIIKLREKQKKEFENEQNTEYICELCKKTYLLKDGYTKRFCSIHCSKSFSSIKSKEEKNRKISLKLRKVSERKCEVCGKLILKKNKSGLCKKCFDEKKRIERYLLAQNKEQLNRISYLDYRRRCKFKFSIKKYSNEFDIDLIRKFGWYSAKNRGNNLNGVTRDHMYSVMEGFINNVDPGIISHPANCKLMLQPENSSKHVKSSITLEELKERIKIWDQKYGQNN